MTEKENSNNIMRFEQLMTQVQRPGIERLMEYIKSNTDFYKAPASTRFHLSCEGGLLQHSLNVYDCLIAKKSSPIWVNILAQYPEESLIIMALLHDFCKANFYTKGYKNQKTYDPEKVQKASPKEIKSDPQGKFIWETIETYEINDMLPLGHGEKSVIILQKFIMLTWEEIFAIRWHMGFSENKDNWNTMGDAMEKLPIILALHEADLEASKILEKDM